eukprot:5678907-Prymnesium_polylepis.2
MGWGVLDHHDFPYVGQRGKILQPTPKRHRRALVRPDAQEDHRGVSKSRARSAPLLGEVLLARRPHTVKRQDDPAPKVRAAEQVLRGESAEFREHEAYDEQE